MDFKGGNRLKWGEIGEACWEVMADIMLWDPRISRHIRARTHLSCFSTAGVPLSCQILCV